MLRVRHSAPDRPRLCEEDPEQSECAQRNEDPRQASLAYANSTNRGLEIAGRRPGGESDGTRSQSESRSGRAGNSSRRACRPKYEIGTGYCPWPNLIRCGCPTAAVCGSERSVLALLWLAGSRVPDCSDPTASP